MTIEVCKEFILFYFYLYYCFLFSCYYAGQAFKRLTFLLVKCSDTNDTSDDPSECFFVVCCLLTCGLPNAANDDGSSKLLFFLLVFLPFAVFFVYPSFSPYYIRPALCTEQPKPGDHCTIPFPTTHNLPHLLPPISSFLLSYLHLFVILHLHLYNPSSSCCTLRPQLSLRIVVCTLTVLTRVCFRQGD
jgi:hypothetical protein